MRILASAKRYVFSRVFLLNLSIAVALFTLFYLTKNMLQVTTETRQNVRTQSETDGTSSSRESYGESVIATDNDSKNASILLNSSVHPSSGNDSIDGMDDGERGGD